MCVVCSIMLDNNNIRTETSLIYYIRSRCAFKQSIPGIKWMYGKASQFTLLVSNVTYFDWKLTKKIRRKRYLCENCNRFRSKYDLLRFQSQFGQKLFLLNILDCLHMASYLTDVCSICHWSSKYAWCVVSSSNWKC